MAVQNVEQHLAKYGGKLPSRAVTPLSSNYRPETDTSNELEPSDAAYFQSLIGVLRWMVELGRVDICLEVSLLSSHLALPRVGHLEEVYHIFAYLKRNHNTEMVFDPSDTVIDETKFPRGDWSSTEFGDLEEELPLNMPKPRGLGFTMSAYVDAAPHGRHDPTEGRRAEHQRQGRRDARLAREDPLPVPARLDLSRREAADDERRRLVARVARRAREHGQEERQREQKGNSHWQTDGQAAEGWRWWSR